MPSHEESVETKLQRIAEKARQEPKFQFTSLFHLMNEEHLLGCFERLRKDAAAGIDEVTKSEYETHLTANLQELVKRLHRMSYRPQPVRRVYIPKAGSDKQRPWASRRWKTNWRKPGWRASSRQCTNRTSSTTLTGSGPEGTATTPCEH